MAIRKQFISATNPRMSVNLNLYQKQQIVGVQIIDTDPDDWIRLEVRLNVTTATALIAELEQYVAWAKQGGGNGAG